MSRPAKFWLWSLFSIAVMGIIAFILAFSLEFSTIEAIILSAVSAIILWVLGLRLLIGGKRPLPVKKLKNPYLATPEEFEVLCAAIFSRRGYKVELTPKGGDYGIDVIARKGKNLVVVAAKCYAPNRPVGNRWVQQILGAMHKCDADLATLITTSTFTKNAIVQAENAPIELIDGDALKDLIRKFWL